MNQVVRAETADPAYEGLYRLGGAAAVIVAALILGEVIGQAFYPPPGTVSDWFARFQNNTLIGLLNFWALEVPMYLMFAPLFLALYAVLRKASKSRMALGVTLALLGIAVFLATNNPYSMLSLSNQYAAAGTDAERSALLAAGQALLAATGQRGIGGFNMGLFLVSIAGLLVSTAMLRSNTFSRPTAYLGIVAHGLSLSDYLRQAITSSPIAVLIVVLPNALFLVIWYSLVGRRLYQLARSRVSEEAQLLS